ncbi:MAG: hypothetical protein UT13_C0001G0142 [Candidatus Pacebacteria bacterium GW2011_GWF2_38_9]|nr:MAG: hypothetical protein US01_C0001G0143 [candidate division TM6 bacterium GW2011_GWF2_28_16]KKQ09116.1 MAG: hypothetical protein US20_C0009G0017 [Candidatus Pacebacteria bacterium GW2011_GWF1_36_5]KKQ88495.1 MAG: hypothetical protein UT13_C0001G0142 [Candidatus Pacebacteria bacterium GW2011_GWF2_38_9]HAZ73370.1 hypothetical protein [Candidatus Paceibacterota bacterium]
MNKEKIQNLFGHPLLIFIFTCLCLLGIFSLRESSRKALVSKESIQKLEKNIEIMENEFKEEEKKFADSQDELATEKIMRNELLQKKEGEIILQIPEKEELNEEINNEMTLEKNGPLEEWKKLMFL